MGSGNSNCKHEKVGTLEVSGNTGSGYVVGRNSHGDHLGAVKLEFCDRCGVVFVGAEDVGLPKVKRSRSGRPVRVVSSRYNDVRWDGDE